jgi:hypothetical protein
MKIAQRIEPSKYEQKQPEPPKSEPAPGYRSMNEAELEAYFDAAARFIGLMRATGRVIPHPQ